MKRLLLASALFLSSCGTPSPAILSDVRLVITTLQTIDALMPGPDGALIGVALTVAQDGLAALQAGAKTPAVVAATIKEAVDQAAPLVLADLHANATITTGVTLLQKMVPVLLEDAAGPQATMPTGAAVDRRAKLAAWVSAAK